MSDCRYAYNCSFVQPSAMENLIALCPSKSHLHQLAGSMYWQWSNMYRSWLAHALLKALYASVLCCLSTCVFRFSLKKTFWEKRSKGIMCHSGVGLYQASSVPNARKATGAFHLKPWNCVFWYHAEVPGMAGVHQEHLCVSTPLWWHFSDINLVNKYHLKLKNNNNSETK